MKRQLRKEEKKQRSPLNNLLKKEALGTPLNGLLRKEVLALIIAVLLAILILVITSWSSEPTTTPPKNVIVNNTSEISTKIYSAGGIYLEYPSSWKITNDEISGTSLQLMIQDPTSASDPNSTQAAGFTVLKLEKDQYLSLEQRKEAFIQSLKDSGANINVVSSNNITLNGINATEATYEGKGPKNEAIHLKVIYFEQKETDYILAFLTKGLDIESQQTNLDVILDSFKLQ